MKDIASAKPSFDLKLNPFFGYVHHTTAHRLAIALNVADSINRKSK
jgi:hypothetical protein